MGVDGVIHDHLVTLAPHFHDHLVTLVHDHLVTQTSNRSCK